MEILLVSHVGLNLMETNIKAAYESVLEEEGVKFSWITHGELWRSTPNEVLRKHRIIIFPDYVSQKIPFEFSVWVEDFSALGGDVFIIYNTGTMVENRSYREHAVFSRLLGMNYITYNQYQSLAFQQAKIRFKDKNAAEFLEIPFGKYDQNFVITGYKYASLNYPIAKVNVKNVDSDEIFVYSEYQDGTAAPNTFLKKTGRGHVLYANLPLGYLKAYSSDDLLIRAYLRTFLFKIARFPHLCNTPYNKAGIVLNWHVDDYKDQKNIEKFEQLGFFRKNLPNSFHITAGDFVNEPSDNKGFNASLHPQLVRKLMQYGTIGSHGGWAHNWFAKKLMREELTPDEVAYYIDLNNKVLQMITNYPIKEYSAPEGRHPQPLITDTMRKLGMTCYYYTGDMGSRPNRTFFRGKMISKTEIAFPTMPLESHVSVMELGWEDIDAGYYETWWQESVNYLVKNRTISLFYSHLYDFDEHKQFIAPYLRNLNRLEKLQQEDQLIVQTMTYFTDFMQRFLTTNYSFTISGDRLIVDLKNKVGLDGISVAVPKNLCRRPLGSGFYITENENYFFVNLTEKIYEKIIICHLL
jgi:hypothetical protein